MTDSVNDQDKWMVDSGCTEHLLPYLDNFVSKEDCTYLLWHGRVEHCFWNTLQHATTHVSGLPKLQILNNPQPQYGRWMAFPLEKAIQWPFPPLYTRGEYLSSDLRTFLSKNGIKHQMTVPHIPQQNGKAEHFNCTLLEKSKVMWQHAYLLPFFWQDAVETSLHIYNRQPICHHKWYTFIQLWNGTKPDIHILLQYFWLSGICLHTQRQVSK